MASRKDSDQPLKAILFADSCAPDDKINLAAGKKLLNTPIISWQIANLARYGVKEVIVLSSTPIEKIHRDPLDRIKITKLSSSSWSGEGDALREVEGRDDLRPVDDFILVRCGSIFNVDVSRLVAGHKQRREIDRNWLITTAFRSGAGSATSGLVIAVDSTTGTLVKYVESGTGLNIDVRAENAGLQQGGVMKVHSDVLDIGLDVCAPDFMTEFRENFYYDHVRAYIKEKLDGGDAEVFGNRMYAYFLNSAEGEYGTRITSLASFVQATSDALNGWMTPITETANLDASAMGNGHEYARDYVVDQCVIGYNVDIGVGSTIVNSVIGEYVNIGSDTLIANSIIMNNVTIADRAEIEGSVIDTRCTVREDSLVPKYCYLDREVYLGVGCRSLPLNSFVTTREGSEFKDSESDESDQEGENKKQDGDNNTANGASSLKGEGKGKETVKLGALGKGRILDVFVASRIDYFFVPKFLRSQQFDEEEEDEIEEEEGSDDGNEHKIGEAKDINGQIDGITQRLAEGTLEDDVDDEDDRIARFHEEVFETLERAFAENVEVDNTALEVNSLKLVYNCSFAETLTGVVAGLASAVQKASSHPALYGAVHGGLMRYRAVISKFNKSDENHQLSVTSGIAKALSADGTLLSYVFKVMYDDDMLEEEAILGWASAERKRMVRDNENEAILENRQMKEFLEWLEDSDEEDDDED